jgi:hypothetical protein
VEFKTYKTEKRAREGSKSEKTHSFITSVQGDTPARINKEI